MSINARSDAARATAESRRGAHRDCSSSATPGFLLQPFWEPVDDGAPNEVGGLGTGTPELKAAPDAPSSKSRQRQLQDIRALGVGDRGCRYPLVA